MRSALINQQTSEEMCEGDVHSGQSDSDDECCRPVAASCPFTAEEVEREGEGEGEGACARTPPRSTQHYHRRLILLYKNKPMTFKFCGVFFCVFLIALFYAATRTTPSYSQQPKREPPQISPSISERAKIFEIDV